MPDNRMQIEITADNRQSVSAVKGVQTELGSLERQALRIAQQIASGFGSMARQIQQAIQTITQSMSGMQAQAGRLVDQFGRPIHTKVMTEQIGTSTGMGGAGVAAATAAGRGMSAGDYWAMRDKNAKRGVFLTDEDIADFKAKVSKISSMRPEAVRSGFSYLGEQGAETAVRWQHAVSRQQAFHNRGVQALKAEAFSPEWMNAGRAWVMRDNEVPKITKYAQEMEKLNEAFYKGKTAADQLAGATGKAGDSMAGGMLKAGAMYAAFEGGISIVKTLTIESAKLAAETQMYGVALNSVAKSSGYSKDYLKDQANAIKELGITTRESKASIIQMTTAGMDVSAAPKLARMAQNLAVMRPDETSSSMFQRLIYGIQSGQTEVLRTAGVNVNFENEYAKFAKAQKRTVDSLCEEEKIRLRLNTVLAQSNRFHGMYDDAMGTTGKQMQSLRRFTEEAQVAIGEKLIPALSGIVGIATTFAKVIAENPMIARLVTVAATTLSGAAVGAAAGSVIPGAGTAAGAAWGAAAGFLGGAASVVNSNNDVVNVWASKEAAAGKAEAEQKKQSDAAWKKFHPDATLPDTKAINHYAETLRSLREELAKSIAEEQTGITKIMALRQVELDQLKAKKELTKETAALVNAKTVLEIGRYNKQQLSETGAALIDSANGYFQNAASHSMDAAGKRDQLNRELFDADRQQMEESLSAQMDIAKRWRDRRMAEEDQGNAITLAQKLAVEQKKLQIDLIYMEQAKLKERELLDFKAEMAKLEVAIRWAGNQKAIDQLNSQIDGALTNAKKRLDQQYGDQVRQSQLDSTRQQTAMVREEWMKAWDSVKNGGEHLFDALISKTESFGDAIKNILKAAFLTPMREIAGSFAAKLFTPMAFNLRQRLQGVAAQQMGGVIPGVTPGTTPPFIPYGPQYSAPVALGGVSAIPGLVGVGMGPGGQIVNAPGMTRQQNGMSGMFQNMPVVGTKSAQNFFGQSGSMGKYGGAVQGGLMMGGAALAMDGWSRGGWGGAAEMAGGGAAIGMAVGGPMGAAVGAAIGFGVGAFRAMFLKTPMEKMKQAIKSIHGLRVDDKTFLKAMVESCKQSGLKPEAFLKTKTAYDMLENYALQTGQKFKNPYNLGQFNMLMSGGQIYEAATSLNSVTNTQLSSLPGMGFSSGLDGIRGGPSSTGPMVLSVKLDGPATTQLMKGEAVQAIAENPRAVSQANTAAMNQNVGRFSTITARNPSQLIA